MVGTPIEELSIRVSADTSQAVDNLKKLTDAVTRLSNTNVKSGNLTNNISEIKRLADSLKDLNVSPGLQQSAKTLNTLGTAFRKFTSTLKVDDSKTNITKLKGMIAELNSISVNSNVTTNGKALTTLANSFNKLSNFAGISPDTADKFKNALEVINGFTVGDNVTASAKGIRSLTSALGKLSGLVPDTSKIEQTFTSIQGLSVGDKLAPAVKTIRSLISALGRLNNFTGNQEAVNSIQSTLSAIENSVKDPGLYTTIGQSLIDVSRGLRSLISSASKLSEIDIDRFSMFIKQLENLKGIQNFGNISIRISDGKVSRNGKPGGEPEEPNDGNREGDADPSAKDYAPRGVANAWKQIVENVKSHNKEIKLATSGLRAIAKFTWNIEKSLGKGFGAYFSGLGKSVSGVIAPIKSFTKSIGRIAFYRAIRTAIKEVTQAFSEGMKHLYLWSEANNKTFANSMDTLATATNYLKNSLGAAISPIINAVAPVIDTIIDKFVNWINVVNQLISALTGASTWTKAIKVQQKYNAETKKATDNTKKLKATILDLDEIHLLNGQNDGGSGSGADNSAWENAFETRKVDGGISGIINKLKRMASNGQWESIGVTIAMGLNKGLTKVKTTFTGFNDWLTEKLSNIAGVINGFSIFFNWESLGDTVGEGINSITEPINTFVDKVNWKVIGMGLGRSLRGLINGVNWTSLGAFLANKFKIVVDGLSGFLEDAKTNNTFAKCGNALKELVLGFFNRVDWGTLGWDIAGLFNGIATTINSFLGDGKVGSKISESFSTAIENFISNLDLVELFSAAGNVAKTLGNIAFGIISGIGKGLMSQLGDFADRFKRWINKAWDDTKGNVWDFGVKIGKEIFRGLRSAIMNNPLVGILTGTTGSIGAVSAIQDILAGQVGALNDGELDPKVRIDVEYKSKLGEGIANFVGGLFGNHTSSTSADVRYANNSSKSTVDGIGSIGGSKTATLSVKDNFSGTNAYKGYTNLGNKTPIATLKAKDSISKSKEYSFWEKLGNKTVEANMRLKLTDIVSSIKQEVSYQRDQAAIKFQFMANGGMIDARKGTGFIAGENGPEILGHVNGRTEVMNTMQMQAAVEVGMANANYEQNELLRQQNRLLTQILAKTGQGGVTTGDIKHAMALESMRAGYVM